MVGWVETTSSERYSELSRQRPPDLYKVSDISPKDWDVSTNNIEHIDHVVVDIVIMALVVSATQIDS